MKTNENNTTTAIAAQSTKSTVLLSIDKIRPNPNNPRRSYDENALAELAASIATHGLIQPIRVRAAEQDGYIIVCGERRYRAVQLLGQTEIEAIVDTAPADERAIFDLALSENIQREEMPPLDEAEAYKAAMQTLRGDAAAVAARFGKSEQYIYYRMKLDELIPDIKKLLRENSITLGLAMELARYGKDLQKTICKDRLKNEEGWRKYSVKEFKRMVDAHYTNDLARYRFDQTACAACKYNNWDCIILTHEQFGKIPQSAEVQQRILRQEMDDIDENLASYEKQGGHVDGWILRGLEKRKENLDAKLHELQETIDAQKDDTVDFQQMGIDHLFVDESHYQNF